mmetsp:Transcript_18308/g.41869  ORF Transcript_18308/g.41869 Transcript_18308/m.41869 type:complete len:304 (+) Transcript_18308:1557-2468(+)
MNFKGIKHSLPGHDNLLGLFFHRKRSNEGRDLLRRFPLGKLGKTFLAGPDAGVNNFEKELASSGIENENGTIDGFRGEISLEGFMDGDTVHVGVVDKPDDLITEELSIILTTQVGFCGFTAVELQTLANPFSQDIECRVGLHDLCHGLLQQGFAAGNIISISRIQTVPQIDRDETSRGRGIDAHVIRGIIQKFGPCIPFDIVGIEIAPPELHVQPIFIGGAAIVFILGVVQETGPGRLPLVGGEQDQIGTGTVHLVGFSGVDGLLLHALDFEGIQFLIEDLHDVHGDGLVYLLPEMGPEDLNE